jgi:predicted nucleic acid-binding protein
MTYGVDTTFLVEVEATESTGHNAASAWLRTAIRKEDRLALAPQVLAEFVHVVTDSARFNRPLDTSAAVARAAAWWTGAEVRQVYPNEAAIRLFLDWMRQHRLGRKRILDTMLAATYFANGVTEIVTTNARDYAIFGALRAHTPEL